MRDEETDVQIDPPCIWVLQAPYADDIRYPTVDECQSAVDVEGRLSRPHTVPLAELQHLILLPNISGDDNPLVENFKKLIKKMRVQYSPHQFPNPGMHAKRH